MPFQYFDIAYVISEQDDTGNKGNNVNHAKDFFCQNKQFSSLS